jgi:dihydroorotase
MENNIENALWKDYNDLGDIMKVIGESNEQKSDILDERDRIRQELIKLEQSKNEIRVKREEIDAEDKREQVRNRITMITFGVSTGLSLYAIIMTFYFDRDRTVTSTLGRNILNSVLPLKLFSKR